MTPIAVNCVGNRILQVEAHVFGEWAAHMGVDSDMQLMSDWWVVTHVPTGRCIASATGQMQAEEAIRLASALGERLPCGLIAEIPQSVSFAEIPLEVKKRIRSVIFDVRGEVRS